MNTQFLLAPPRSTTQAHAADLLGRSAAAAAILWNTHVALTGPEQFLRALTTALRVPAERPSPTPDGLHSGALLRLATRTHRLAGDLTAAATARRRTHTSTCQALYTEAFNEYLSRHPRPPRQ
ncbi:hypothetical protein ACNUDN_30240 [Mycobacterium sp. smrl_JER01]|uniref:hypothetical protein n=1 Tax=Mycobacterium sp. smrl_JER01 TaxID=3402633 RepID=UPI003ABFDFCA